MIRSILGFVAVLAALSLVFGCATAARNGAESQKKAFAFSWKEDFTPYTPGSDVSPETDFNPVWETYREGILIARTIREHPQLAVYCVRVDLHSPWLSVIVSPGSTGVSCEYRGKKTTAFLRKYRCAVAVNGAVFTPYISREGACTNVGGLSVSGGVKYSAYGCGPVFSVKRDKSVCFGDSWGMANPALYALEGRELILRFRSSSGFYLSYNRAREPRTVIGLSQGGRYLFLMVIDGRNDKHSVGATLREASEWLMAHGAYSGINLDGGGSSTLAVADSRGNPVILNQCSEGRERVVANHIGIVCSTSTGPSRNQ